MASTRLAFVCCIALGAVIDSGSVAAQSNAIPDHIENAIRDPRRPENDTARDPNQKPAELLAFSGVEPGDRVADFWPLPPYSTRVLASAVGDRGRVFAVMPEKVVREVPEAETDIRDWLSPYSNTTLLIQPFDAFEAPEPLDVVYMGKIYHDFPNEAEMGPLDISAVNERIFQSLKPGGVYVIVDHAASPGSGYLDVEPDMSRRLHRIDYEIVKQQVESVGFVLESESDMLANPDDPRNASPFDPSIRERTDRFVLKFRKPR